MSSIPIPLQLLDEHIASYSAELEISPEVLVYRDCVQQGSIYAALGPPVRRHALAPAPSSTDIALTQRRPLIQVPQHTYDTRQGFQKEAPMLPVEFHVDDQKGIRLIDALKSNVTGMRDGDEQLLLSEHSGKINLRIQVRLRTS